MRREHIEYKTMAQLRKIRKAALIVNDIHTALRQAAKPGVTTKQLDDVALRVLHDHGAKSNFMGYEGYPAQTCISVNDVIVHGIPGDHVLEPGDILSFDCGCVLNGWHGDAAFTMVLPGGDEAVHERREWLCEVTRRSMWVGIAAMAHGAHVGDIGAAIDDYISGLSPEPGIVEDYVGHGIGTQMHQDPDVPNYRTYDRGAKLKPGMVLCIEPMITAGDQDNFTEPDEWTVRTEDGSDAAHWESEVALTDKGIWVMNLPDGGASELARFGITPVPLGE
ncbi:MAG: type I methionyl aminopeptidase [Actinomycetaceae bacterium]|nr:type I methionyl aminopeptidase [Actinomycetaceae bacterium]MDY6082850.1 type I methionyl aminopeptidase [Actinomycetaceae bacterium]